MKDSGGKPVLRLDLPAPRPKTVETQLAEFDRVATEVARLQGEKRETRQELELARKADRAEYAARLAQDFDAEPTTENEDAINAKAAEIEAKLPILGELAHTAGDALVHAVGDALEDGWRDELEEAEQKAAARVNALVSELDVALQDYGKAKAASSWAQKFEVPAALTPGWHRVPDVRYRPGASATVPMRQNLNLPSVNGVHQVPASVIVTALRGVTAEPEQPRTAPLDEKAVIV
jgi:hypothetical protein